VSMKSIVNPSEWRAASFFRVEAKKDRLK
jgi:hypothetical protein